MAASDEHPALAHIEKALADSYRKEIDQEENVWRSLPFFAATLALQMAALVQILGKLPDPKLWNGMAAMGCLAMVALCTIAALGFVASSIYLASFDYISTEPELLEYTWSLIQFEYELTDHELEGKFSAILELKRELARQYARATHHNRQINSRRMRRRSIAGLLVLTSVFCTVLLVIFTFWHYPMPVP